MASLGHEFRTPMNAILGFLGLLRETFQVENLKSKKELLNFIDSIEKASHSLLRLITNIMEFSKVDSGKLKLDYKIENLNGDIVYVDTLRVHDMPSADDEIGDAQDILYCPNCFSWRNR